MAVVAVDEAVLDFVEDLPDYVEAHPDPHVLQVVLRLAPHLELLELAHLLSLVAVRQVEEHHSQNYHNPVNHDLPEFCNHQLFTFAPPLSLINERDEHAQLGHAKPHIGDDEGHNIRFPVLKPDGFFEVLHGEVVDEGGEVKLIDEGLYDIPDDDIGPQGEADVD